VDGQPKRQDERKAELESLTTATLERLAEQLAEGHTSEFLDLMAFYAQFWRYSLNNVVLIKQQCPQARRVASYSLWSKLGFQVAKGQKAIWIFCPIIAKTIDEATGETVERVTAFKPCPVFDASQLTPESQEQLPSLHRPLPVDLDAYWQNLCTRCREQDITIEECPLPRGVDGAATSSGLIKIRATLDGATKVLVLAHELAHRQFHFKEEAKELTIAELEWQAEATAAVVAAMLGVTYPASRDYLLTYRADADSLRTHFPAIQRCVKSVAAIMGIDDVPQLRQADTKQAA
jgi:hypothetical protein